MTTLKNELRNKVQNGDFKSSSPMSLTGKSAFLLLCLNTWTVLPYSSATVKNRKPNLHFSGFYEGSIYRDKKAKSKKISFNTSIITC